MTDIDKHASLLRHRIQNGSKRVWWYRPPRMKRAEAGLLSKSSCSARALGVTKFTNVRDMIWSHFVALLKSDLGVQQTHLRGRFVEHLGGTWAWQQSVTKFITSAVVNGAAHIYVMQNRLIEGSSEKAHRTFLKKQNFTTKQIWYYLNLSAIYKKYIFVH